MTDHLESYSDTVYKSQVMSRSAFTLGNAKAYDSYIAKAPADDPPAKLGRCVLDSGEPYGGGWLWRDAETARAFLASKAFAAAFPGRDPEEFAVYRVELPTGWEADASGPDPSDGVCRLLNDAEIIERVSRPDLPRRQTVGAEGQPCPRCGRDDPERLIDCVCVPCDREWRNAGRCHV